MHGYSVSRADLRGSSGKKQLGATHKTPRRIPSEEEFIIAMAKDGCFIAEEDMASQLTLLRRMCVGLRRRSELYLPIL